MTSLGAGVLGAAAAATANAALPSPGTSPGTGSGASGVFALGVASGDPLPTAVVIWTRLVPATSGLSGAAGALAASVPVTWEVASDEGFATVVARGTASATEALGHSVHVDVTGLSPATRYWYRFTTLGKVSRTGRTLTAPAAGSTPDSFRIALASCQHWQHGYFTAYRDMLAKDPDVVLFVGDFIYETVASKTAVRTHEGTGEPVTLDQYRSRYAQYQHDPDLQAMRAAAPWIVTFDDHEVDNDWAGHIPQDPDKQSSAAFKARQAAAFQAYYENMPVRASAVPVDASISMYRALDFGSLVKLHVLDTRQYRSDQASTQADAQATSQVMLSAAQKKWLVDGAQKSGAVWNLIGSQIMFSETDLQVGDGKLWYYDAWDGYQAERNALQQDLSSVRNLVVLSGDRHRTIVSDIKLDFADAGSAVIGAEFVGTSVSSAGDEDLAAFAAYWTPIAAANPAWKLIDAHRGYLLLDLTPTAITAEVRAMDTVLTRDGTASALARFRVVSDVPGVTQI